MDALGSTGVPGKDIGSFLADVVSGLGREQKQLPCKYFYDERGSQLFVAISGLEEYYLTRTETALIEAHGGELRLESTLGAGTVVTIVFPAKRAIQPTPPVHAAAAQHEAFD